MSLLYNKVSSSSLSKYAYTYDALGRRVNRQQTGSEINRASTDNFSYNTRSEVTASTNSVETAAAHNPTYNYDPGNVPPGNPPCTPSTDYRNSQPSGNVERIFEGIVPGSQRYCTDPNTGAQSVIEETEKYFVQKINILGNNITRESVIRNKFLIDEGDPFNAILANKTLNEIKSLNFFKDVESQIIDDDINKTKIINITVEEKPTGEIMAGAGFGTDGEVIEIGVKENNYLGKGLAIDTNLSVGSDKVNGEFNIVNPNYNNSDKLVKFGLRASESDRLESFGYKSKKIGGLLGTKFEYLEDFRIGIETSSFIEDMETDSTASNRQKKQEGNYFDTYIGFDFDYDKRNQKYQTSDGFRSYYSLSGSKR